ncbi:MAG TPA: hypothetical protein VGE36_01010 [Roseateles sp.]
MSARLLSAALALTASFAATAQGMCPGEPLCRQTASFTATVTDFRVSPSTQGNRPVDVTLRFTNRSGQPLILGQVAGTAAAYDDRGHRYTLQNTRLLTGMGLVERNRFDPKFRLGPGESADARMTLNFYAKNVVVGTRFDLEMSVREIEPLPGQQYRLGREHALSWQSLGQGAAAVPMPASPAAPKAAEPHAPPASDACQGLAHCATSGPVLARLVGATPSTRGNYHHVTLRIAFQNQGATPLILNYKQNTGQAIDERGERYAVDTYREAVQGMPMATRQRASSQFTLAPGESRTAAFDFRRFTGKVPAGSVLTPSIAVEQYELLPANQLQLVREHALSFGSVPAGGSLQPQQLGDALRNLGEALKRVRP